jgi:hypothetical protein
MRLATEPVNNLKEKKGKSRPQVVDERGGAEHHSLNSTGSNQRR